MLVNLAHIPSINRFQIRNIGKLHSDELRVLEEVLVMLGDQGSQTLLNQVQLIQVVFPWKERFSIYGLGHDAADGPDVDGLVVVVSTDQ